MNRKILLLGKILVTTTLSTVLLLSQNYAFANNIDQSKVDYIIKINKTLVNSKSVSLQNTNLLSLVKERKSNALSLMRNNPLAFIALAIKTEDKKKLSSIAQNYIESEEILSGKIIHIIAENKDEGIDGDTYFIDTGSKLYNYYPASSLDIVSGTRVKIKGYTLDNNFVSNTNKASLMSIGDTPNQDTIGNQKTVVFLVKSSDNAPEPYDAVLAKSLIFNGQFQNFIKDQSNNQTYFSGDVFGWYNINQPMKNVPCNNILYYDWAPMIKKYNVNLNDYNRVLIVSSDVTFECSTVGKLAYINGDTYNVSVSIVNANGYNIHSLSGEQNFTWTQLDQILAHELGHALGLNHANGWQCLGNDIYYGDCKHTEYANSFDVMGIGKYSIGYGAKYREQLGWIPQNQILNITSSGEYEINPLESSASKYRFAKISLPNVKTPYYLEFRNPIGFDANLSKEDLISNTNGLFVNYVEPTYGYLYDTTSVLDMSPNNVQDWVEMSLHWRDIYSKNVTLNLPGSGNSVNKYYDQGRGITIGPITNVSKNTSNASLSSIKFRVDFSQAQCVRSEPALTNPTKSDTVPSGSYGWFTVSVLNKDYYGCDPSDFKFEVVSPQSWHYYNFGNDYISQLSNDAMIISGVSFDVPENTVTGDYKIVAKVTNVNSGLFKTIEIPIHVNGKTASPITINQWEGPVSTVLANSNISFKLHFQGGPSQNDQAILLSFVDSDGVVKFVSYVNPSTPTSQWAGSITVPGTARIPYQTIAGSYKVMASLYDISTGVQTSVNPVQIGFITVLSPVSSSQKNIEIKKTTNIISSSTPNLPSSIPSVLNRSQASNITVLPWQGPSVASADSTVYYSLNFRGGPTKESQRVFVHFIDEKGNVAFVSDAVPSVPSTQWSQGKNLLNVSVKVPADIKLGSYRVSAGLYNGQKRMSLIPGDGVTVEASDPESYQVGSMTVLSASSFAAMNSSLSNSNTASAIYSAQSFGAVSNKNVESSRNSGTVITSAASVNSSPNISSVPNNSSRPASLPRTVSVANAPEASENRVVEAPVTINPWSGPASANANTSISFTLNFQGGPTKNTQRVFVHFVDSTGNIAFVGDASPSTDTTQWSGNASIPFTISIPNNVKNGDYKVMAGLFSGGSRLSLITGSGVSADGETRYQVGNINIQNNAL